jgi:putative membrane protein
MTNRQINFIIIAISVIVPSVVVALLKIQPPTFKHEINLMFFPKLNAMFNTGTSLCLILGLAFIKNKNSNLHRIAMLTALLLSSLFLLSYVFYHTLKAEDTKFLGQGIIRPIYYFILITHIILAAIILPFVLKTFSFAFLKQFDKHKLWAKYTYPFWLYVAISGVLVYVLLSPYY